MTDADRSFFTPISRDVRARAAIYASVLLAYLAAVHADPLTPSMLLIFFLAGLWSLGFEHRFLRPFFPSALKIGLILTGSLVFIVFFLGGLSRPADTFANAIARFLFWNAIVFVLSRNKTEYDVWTLGIIDVSLFMISGAFVQPAAFLPLLLGALACVLYAFQRLALLRCGPAGEHARHGATLLLVQLTLVLEIAAVVFFLFPRSLFRGRLGEAPAAAETPAGGGGTPAPVPGAVTKTGLPQNPDELNIESLAPLKQDKRTALKMRVNKIDGYTSYIAGDPLYLRGAVFEKYERGRWTAEHDPRELAAGPDGWIRVADLPGRAEMHHEIKSVPTGGDVAVAVGEPVRLKWPRAKYDASGTFYLLDRTEQQSHYGVVSRFIPDDAPGRLRAASPVPTPALLQLPAGLERLRSRAADLIRGRRTPVEKVLALQAWLARDGGFSYKLASFAAPAGVDPIDYFLFSKREGYCMHFATALALLCRAAGIPARVATGFRAKEYAVGSNEYTVRNSDAHAWVEIPFPGQGWIRFDATPEETEGAPPGPEGAPVATGDTRKAEEKKEGGRWDRFLVEYDPALQGSAFKSAGAAIGAIGGLASRVLLSPAAWVVLGSAALAGAVAWILMPRSRKARLRQILGGFRERSSVDFYRDFLWLASKKGVHKAAGQTGREFAAQAGGVLPRAPVELITDRFYEVKFGGRTLESEEGARLRAALREIEAWAATPVTPP